MDADTVLGAHLVIRFFFALVMALMIPYLLAAWQADEAAEDLSPAGRRYLPVLIGAMMPVMFLAMFLVLIITRGLEESVRWMGFSVGPITLQISVWFAVLLTLLPWLRRQFRARTCAVLWMLPNLLYVAAFPFMIEVRPLWIIPVPAWLLRGLSVVWITGGLAVFVGKMAEHLWFRQKILRDSVPVQDPAVLTVFAEEVRRTFAKDPKLRVVRSPEVSTPLSIGLFRRTVRVVLPDRDFTPEEYRLIFRHELVHISREDAASRFFLLFCTALCWFNPLVWMAARASAEDLELSCDESVLRGEDDGTRMAYARLLLRTAGDDRGFSTCLSAAASTLRYRLKAVMGGTGPRSGILFTGLAVFLLLMTCGFTGFAVSGQTGRDVIYGGQDPEPGALTEVLTEGGSYTARDPVDFSALEDWLSAQPMAEVLGRSSAPGSGKHMILWLNRNPLDWRRVEIQGDSVILMSSSCREWKYFRLQEPADWDWLDSLLPPQVEAKGTTIARDGVYSTTVTPGLLEYACVTPGHARSLITPFPDGEHVPTEYYMSPLPDLTHIDFTFTFRPVAPPRAEVCTLDGSYPVVSALTEEDSVWSLPLPAGPVRCTLFGTFHGPDGLEYEATFGFVLGDTGPEYEAETEP